MGRQDSPFPSWPLSTSHLKGDCGTQDRPPRGAGRPRRHPLCWSPSSRGEGSQLSWALRTETVVPGVQHAEGVGWGQS